MEMSLLICFYCWFCLKSLYMDYKKICGVCRQMEICNLCMGLWKGTALSGLFFLNKKNKSVKKG